MSIARRKNIPSGRDAADPCRTFPGCQKFLSIHASYLATVSIQLHSKYALKNPDHVFNREIRVVVHHEDAPRWCTHPWSHVQILHIGHHLCARLFIPDRAVHSVDGWPSPSLLSSRYILLLLLLYLFFLLFLHLVLLFHYLRVCAVPFPFHGRCASDTNHPLYLIHATPELCVGITRTKGENL